MAGRVERGSIRLRNRFLTTLMMVLLLAASIVLSLGFLDDSQSRQAGQYQLVTVAPGDTLWSIARGIVGEEGDPRRVIYSIKILNELPDGTIRPGMTLTVPKG